MLKSSGPCHPALLTPTRFCPAKQEAMNQRGRRGRKKKGEKKTVVGPQFWGDTESRQETLPREQGG